MPISADKKKALEATLQQIEKKFGKESVVDFNKQIDKNIKVIPSGSLLIDAALGVGGYPKGRIIEIFGQESSGKTTLTLHAIAEAQKQGMVCAFVDAEYAFDQDYAETFGIDVNDDNTFKLFHPDSGEDAFEIVDSLIRSGAVDVIVVDSVAALVPKAELEGTMEDNQMGLQARMMSKALRKITGSISKTNCTLFLINQTRLKIGVMYGNPETTTGGTALKFYASVRIEVRKSTTIKDGDTPIGHEMVVKVIKNKVAPPFKTAKLTFMYGEGISKLLEIIDVGIEMGIIEKSGGWYTIEGERVSGKDRLKDFLEKNSDVMKKLEDKIRAKLASGDSKMIEEEKETNEKVEEENDEEVAVEEEAKTKSSSKKSKKK